MRPRQLCAPGVVLLLFVGACDSPTAPRPDPLVVTLGVAGAPATFYLVEEGVPQVACEVGFEARATGRGGAVWTGATMRYFAGVDRDAPLDSAEFSVSEGPLFRQDSLTSARPDTSHWRFASPLPFAIEARFRYRVGADPVERSVSSRFDCGPTTETTANPPSITLLEVRGNDAVLEAGDTLIVRYRVDGGGALWQSSVRVSGPFVAARESYEELRFGGEREVRFVVPRRSLLNLPVYVEIQLVDVGGRQASLKQTTAIRLQDVKPPVISNVVFRPGQYGTGQSIYLLVTSSDDNDLAWIIWQFDDPVSRRDSMPVGDDPLITMDEIPVPSREEWSGLAGGITVTLRDAAGNLSATVRSSADAYRFYPTVTTPTISSANIAVPGTFGSQPDDIAYDARRNRLYLTHTYPAYVSNLDVATMTIRPPIAMPPWPGAADLTVSGDSLLVTQSADLSLSVIDLDAWVHRAPIRLTALDSLPVSPFGSRPMPTGVRVAANGKAIVEVHEITASGHRTIEVDLAAGSNRFRTDATPAGGSVDNWWSRMAAMPDRARVLILDPFCARFYVAATDSFSACSPGFPALPSGSRISSDASAGRILIGDRLMSADLTLLRQLEHTLTDLLPDGDHFMTAVGRSLVKVRASDGRFISRMVMPFEPSRLYLLPDGLTLLVFRYDGQVSRVDVSGM